MLKLDYIMVGKLPDEQLGYLKENLQESEIESRDLTEIAGKLEKLKKTEKFVLYDKFDIDILKNNAETSILISGDAGELREAARLNIAVIAYIPPQSAEALPDEQTLPAGAEVLSDEPGAEALPDVPGMMPPADMYAEGFEEIGLTFLQHVYERHHHIPWTILTTERCVVKEFSMDYLDDLFTLYEGEGMTDYMEPLFPYEQEKEYQQAYIENMYNFYGYGMWIVCEKESGKLIGRAGLEHREEFGGELELGYAIGVPYQRKGYATEVCEAILDYAGEELGFSEVYCLIEEENSVSAHFAGKLGFSYQETVNVDGKMMRRYRYWNVVNSNKISANEVINASGNWRRSY